MTSESLVLHSTTVPWWLLVSPLIISGIYLWCRGMCGGIVLVVPVRDFLFAHSRILNWGPLDLYTYTLPLHQGDFWFNLWQFLWCRGIGGGIALIGPVRDFLFALSGHCTTVPWGLLVSTLTSLEGLVVVLFWLDLWEIFFLSAVGFWLMTSESLVLHSTTVPWWFLVSPLIISGI